MGPDTDDRRRSWTRVAGLLGLWVALVASTAACAVPPPSPTPMPTLPPGERQSPEQAARRAVNVLADRLAVAPAAITIISVEPQTWPDTSLGLPEPEQVYAQVVTRGYVVTLEYARQVYVYHVAGDTVRFNEKESTPLPPTAGPF